MLRYKERLQCTCFLVTQQKQRLEVKKTLTMLQNSCLAFFHCDNTSPSPSSQQKLVTLLPVSKVEKHAWDWQVSGASPKKHHF
jgi:hypothetical protein